MPLVRLFPESAHDAKLCLSQVRARSRHRLTPLYVPTAPEANIPSKASREIGLIACLSKPASNARRRRRHRIERGDGGFSDSSRTYDEAAGVVREAPARERV